MFNVEKLLDLDYLYEAMFIGLPEYDENGNMVDRKTPFIVWIVLTAGIYCCWDFSSTKGKPKKKGQKGGSTSSGKSQSSRTKSGRLPARPLKEEDLSLWPWKWEDNSKILKVLGRRTGGHAVRARNRYFYWLDCVNGKRDECDATMTMKGTGGVREAKFTKTGFVTLILFRAGMGLLLILLLPFHLLFRAIGLVGLI